MADDKELLVRIKGLDELTPILTKALASMEAAADKLAASVDKINPPLETAKAKSEGLNTGMVNLASTMSVVKDAVEIANKVWEALSETVGKAIEEAEQAEKAANLLTGALVSQGKYTEATVKSLEKYVQTVEATTDTDGEAIKTMVAMGIQMGLTTKQSEQMEEAARKLAAVTGTDVMSAFNQLQGSLNGQTRALAKVLPQVKDLTEAQLKNGAAITLVSEGLDAQYQLYEKSYTAAVNKATNSINDVYKTLGALIIQNPLVIKGVQLFAEWMGNLQTAIIETTKWVQDHSEQILKLAENVGKAVIVLGAITAAFVIATSAAGAAAVAMGYLGTAFAVLTGPIGLAVIAVATLTAAFYKWPGLFDQIAGSFKIFAGIFLEGIGFIADKAAKLVSIFDKDMARSLSGISEGITNQAQKWQLAGVAQTEYGDTANKTADVAVAAVGKENAALDQQLVKLSAVNAAKKNGTKTFGGINEGTTETRKKDSSASSQEAEDLKNFKEFLDAKKALAIAGEESQVIEVNKIRAEALKGGTGAEASRAGINAEIDAETEKQAQLEVLRQTGVLNESQYQEALIGVKQRYAQLNLDTALVQKQILDDALGNSEQGYALKKQIEQQRFDLELQQKVERAQLAGATDIQIAQMQEQAQNEHLANMATQDQAYYDAQAAMQEKAGNNFQAYLSKVKSAQVTHGTVLGAVIATQQTEQFKATQTALGGLSGLMSSKSKSMFAIGKAAAVANAVMNTSLAISNALATPPFPLGLALAAVAGVQGVMQVQKITSQHFDGGGQADEGMNSVPGSLDGKSFILSQGERVVQPEANKELTSFLDKEKQGGGSGRGGQTVNVTLNYNGMGSAQDAKAMAEILAKELRSMSERGTQIISSKGVY